MEQGYIPQRNLQQGVVLGWTQQSVLPNEAVEAPSQSASSAVISPASRNNDDTALSESSGQSCSSLKERDYIGLAEVSSSPCSREVETDGELNLAETDLRLGLGPASDGFANGSESLPSFASSHNPEAGEVALHMKEDVSMAPSMSNAWQSVSIRSLVGANPISHTNAFLCTPPNSAPKNGGKRMYAEAMANVPRDARSLMNLNSISGASNVCDPRMSTNQVVPVKDIDKKVHALHPQGVFWAPLPHVPAWQAQSSYRPVANQNGIVFSSATGENDGEVVRNVKLDIAHRSDKTRVQSVVEEDNAPDDAPPAKGQVVGWPPVPSYRRSTLVTRTKPSGDEGDVQSAVYVKVNMEGIPIGRKMDLNAYKSYDSLLTALEDMFHNPSSGPGARFLKGPEFVLTYEDKEGDWMLVGDVPWGMFVNTVRRLRITRGSDMSGLGSRTSCHA